MPKKEQQMNWLAKICKTAERALVICGNMARAVIAVVAILALLYIWGVPIIVIILLSVLVVLILALVLRNGFEQERRR